MEDKVHVLIAADGESSSGLVYFPMSFSVPRSQNNPFLPALHIMEQGLAKY